MVESRTLIIYLFFLIIYSFFVSSFAFEEVNKTIMDYAPLTSTFIKLNQSENLFGSIIKYVLLPFLLIDVIFILLGMIAISFITMPPILSVLIVSPVGIIITFDYILPYVRGN